MQNQHTAILANRRYIDKHTEDRREEAIRIAATVNGDSKRLTVPLDERLRIAREAEEAKNAQKIRLSPKTVEEIAVQKVESILIKGGVELKAKLPPTVRLSIPKDRGVASVAGEPHCAIGHMATIDTGRHYIAVFGGNVRGEIEISPSGKPTLAPGKIIPSTEQTQNQGDYFALVAVKRPGEKPEFSKQALFRLKDIDEVASALCRVLQIPEPEKKVENDKKAEAKSSWRDQPQATPAPSRWAAARPEDLTFAERRLLASNAITNTQDNRRVAGMGMR